MSKLLIFSVFIFSLQSFSQATYNMSNYGGVGYFLKLTTVTSSIGSVDFSLTGANYNWDYSTLGMNSNQIESILNPDNTGYKVPFITRCTFSTGNPFACNSKWNDLTDIAYLELDSLSTPILTIYDVTALMSLKNNVLVANIQGAKAADSGSIVVPITSEFINKDTVYAFPLNYLNQHSSKGKWEVDLNSIGRDIALKVSYTRTYEVEGWGELITPYKTHASVLKVKTIIDEIDSLRYQTFNFGLPRKTVKYTWFDPAYGMPIMEALGQIDLLNNETITQVKYLDSSTIAGIYEVNTNKVRLYPNPTSDYLTISNNNDFKFNSIKLYSLSGKLITNFSYEKGSEINVVDLCKGVYRVVFFNDNTELGNANFIKN
jgi:hypothetical protein